jgi:hypothetical protein
MPNHYFASHASSSSQYQTLSRFENVGWILPPWGRVPVPELTRSAGIKLNSRLSLRGYLHAITTSAGHFPMPVRQYPWAKPSRDHIPLGGFVRTGRNGTADHDEC